MEYIATVYTGNEYYYIGPDSYRTVYDNLQADILDVEGIDSAYISEFDGEMPSGEPVFLHSKGVRE